MYDQNETITNLYINPSYITARYDVNRKPRTKLQMGTRIKNFQCNRPKGVLSDNSMKKIRLAVQWLVFLAEKKKVWENSSQSFVLYRAGLATVSLPTGCTNVSEGFFRDSLLNSIISAMNYRWGLKNYIWKIERQKNGTLHAHITIDKFINHKWLLEKWCTTLDKHGLLEEYRTKFQSMNLKDYVRYRKSTDYSGYRVRFLSEALYVKAIIKAYRKGESDNWSKPNCTDIHAVRDVKNLASYMVKYMCKDPKLGIDFKGRYWSSSHSLSKLKSITVSLVEKNIIQFSKFIEPAISGLEEFYYITRDGLDVRFLGCIYFLKRSALTIEGSTFLSQLFGLIRTLYNNSALDDLPEMHLEYNSHREFKLHKIYDHAN